ncbi:MAG: hypothetical protein ACLT3Y_00035 [Ruminococcus callidus]
MFLSRTKRRRQDSGVSGVGAIERKLYDQLTADADGRHPAFWAACLQASPRTKIRPLFRQHTNSCSQTAPCPQPLPQNRKLT